MLSLSVLTLCPDSEGTDQKLCGFLVHCFSSQGRRKIIAEIAVNISLYESNVFGLDNLEVLPANDASTVLLFIITSLQQTVRSSEEENVPEKS